MSFSPIHPFDLNVLPPLKPIEGKEFHSALIKAHRELAELKGLNLGVPNPMLLLFPSILIQESVASSEIEAIHTTVEEVLQEELFPENERRESGKEVLRYREALMWGFQNLDTLGLSTRLIRGVQERLIGEDGKYRRLQNGIKNKATGEIIYTPPIASSIERLMGNLENFMNSQDENLDPLLQCAIAHYQFEAIHPFGDGNGRTGRILMVLSLIKTEILNYPNLFISGYLIKHRSEYYDQLLAVTRDRSWNSYLQFMLQAFSRQAIRTKSILGKIMTGYFEYKELIAKEHKRIYSADLISHLFSSPFTTPTRMGSSMGIHYTTASSHLQELEKAGLLKSSKVGRHRIFANIKLLNSLVE